MSDAPQTIHGTVMVGGVSRRARRIFNTRHGWSVLYNANLRSRTFRTAPATIAATFMPDQDAE